MTKKEGQKPKKNRCTDLFGILDSSSVYGKYGVYIIVSNKIIEKINNNKNVYLSRPP